MPWSADAAPPGNPASLALRTLESLPLAAVEQLRAHRMTVLSLSAFDVGIADADTAQAAPGTETLDTAAVRAYRRIDWHRDFRSGYAWDPRQLYLDVRVAPVPGADIKTPRELSRFQHVVALARLPGDQGATEFLLQVLDWIDANPVGHGVNWACTMDVALRAVNWIWGLRIFEGQIGTRHASALAIIARGLYSHALHIEDNLEYYEECTGNHYLADIAGLVYIAAADPQFPEADRWLLFGIQELVSEMQREVYADGGAHEGSTHYHRLVAELFASCAAVLERVPPRRRRRLASVDLRGHRVRPPLRKPDAVRLAGEGRILPPAFYERLASMADFTAGLTKPNGRVPQFGDNDSARVHQLAPGAQDVRDHSHLLALVGELAGRADLRELGAAAAGEAALIAGDLRGAPAVTPASSPPLRCFEDSGIAVWREGSMWLALTCGANGQGGRGGHNHNDKNSIELNVHGLDFIADGGCPSYSGAPQVRNAFRSTAAHSTLSVEGREQDPLPPGVGGLFRLPERSRPELQIVAGEIVGRHHGFGVRHERRVSGSDGRVIIIDQLPSSATRWIHFNFDPDVSVHDLHSTAGESHCRLVHAGGRELLLRIQGVADARIEPGHFSVGYGCPVPNVALRAQLIGPQVRTEISWQT
ncbi:MAG TPA: alginate lyase family protein [Steroidobacteraceae bacterium]|nr:alginate lyase family protein [Steroidobacteraceae bacterium]